MSTQFANTLNNHPIYADRAEKDAAGNTITTTYQEKLTAGTGITIDSSNVISATGGGGGSTYTAGNGIDITSDVISVKVTSPTAGDIVTLDNNGHLVDSGVAPSDLQPKLTAGANITIDANNVISSSGGGGGGTSYTAGTGIDISAQDAISVKIDGSTITTNASGQLVANGGGGGSSGATVYMFNLSFQDVRTLFTIDGIDFLYNGYNGDVSITSSTVSRVFMSYSHIMYDGSTYTQSGYIPGTAAGNQYSGVNLIIPISLFSVSTPKEFPKSIDITLFYTLGATATPHVIKMSVLSIYNQSAAENTLYFSVTNS